MIKKRSWYKPFSTVLFCPPSPGSILVKELRKVAEEETRGKGWTVKVVERAGVKLAHQVPGLKEPTVCKKGDCFIHISGGKGECRKEGVVYQLRGEQRGRGGDAFCPTFGASAPGKAHTKSKYFGESHFVDFPSADQGVNPSLILRLT